jgi:hypothetical protein
VVIPRHLQRLVTSMPGVTPLVPLVHVRKPFDKLRIVGLVLE